MDACVPLSTILFIYSLNPPRSNILPSNASSISSSALLPSATFTLCTPRSGRVVLSASSYPPPSSSSSSQSSTPPSSRTTSCANSQASLSPPQDTLGACSLVCFCELRPRAVGRWSRVDANLTTGNMGITPDHIYYDMQRSSASPPSSSTASASQTKKRLANLHVRSTIFRTSAPAPSRASSFPLPDQHPLPAPLLPSRSHLPALLPRTAKVVAVHAGVGVGVLGALVCTHLYGIVYGGWGSESRRNSIEG